jgi:hypothetical protein
MVRCRTDRLPARLQSRHFGAIAGKEMHMSIGFILLIVLLLMVLGAIPAWPHSRGWGYGPSGGLGLVLLIVVILLLMGRI